MSAPRKTVVISLYGTTLDRTLQPDGSLISNRWERWRPTLSLCRQEDFIPDRLELLAQKSARRSAEALLEDARSVSPETEADIHEVHFRDPWDFAEVYAVLRDFAEAYPFNLEENDYYVHITTGTHVAQICLFLLAETRHLPARLIQTSPPSTRGRGKRRAAQGPGTYSIIDLDLSRYDQLAARFQAEHQAGASFLKAGIETRSKKFNALMDKMERVATLSEAPILLEGSTGVGKTQLARRIYELKKRQAPSGIPLGPFVEVNCATLRGDGAMSALFGHVKGAFTGAHAQRDGLLLAAKGGVLFLDELGELGLDEQAMLLRSLEEGVFLPVGSDKPRQSQFQLIAGSNRDLYQAVAEGRFREDLLARIDLWSFALPSLAERLEDVEPNLDFELAKHALREGRKVEMNKEARTRFLDFATSPDALWSANFRDFVAAITRMLTLAGAQRINLPLVEEEILRLETSWGRSQGSREIGKGGPSDETILSFVLGEEASGLDRFDQVQLAEVLRVCQKSITCAAAGRALFSQSRKRKASKNDSDRLKKYLARFDLTWSQVHDEKPSQSLYT